jgi:hypothetical protein
MDTKNKDDGFLYLANGNCYMKGDEDEANEIGLFHANGEPANYQDFVDRYCTEPPSKWASQFSEYKGNVPQLMREAESPIQVFCSYSHSDIDFQRRLEKHLAALKRISAIELWYDNKITPGDNWRDGISENLEKADIILLLVSANFIASDYCYTVEMKRALELHESKQAISIPIIIKACDWEITPIGNLQALPTGSKPVVCWEHEDEAWTDVSKGIRKTIKSLTREKFFYTSSQQPIKDKRPTVFSQEKEKTVTFKMQFLRPNALEILKPLLISFLKTWPTWSFNIARIRGWGARQNGFEELTEFEPKLIKQALKELKSEKKVTVHYSKNTKTTLYKFLA